MTSTVDIHRQGVRSTWLHASPLVRSAMLVFAAAACLLALAAVAVAEPATVPLPPGKTEGWTQVVRGGFNDPNNSYAPYWAKFKDYLYISTSAIEANSVYSGSDKEGSDIWRTADGVTWEQIGTTGLGDPHTYLFRFAIFHDKLYAVADNLDDRGIVIWVTSDGTQFTKIENGGVGDKNNDSAFAYVLADRLILGVSNNETGAEIWVSDDGQTFRQVIDGGMGDSGVTGFAGFTDPEIPDPVFQGKLYVGVSNPDSGGEIWRTADGLEWERTADKGLTRDTTLLLHPDVVYQDQLYAFGTAGGTLDNVLGFDLFRTSDGTTWEQVVDDGFGVGEQRNIHGDLEVFKGRLYLTSNTMDPRVLLPTDPYERFAPMGFQLRVSDDGKTWKQIGEDGFGFASSIWAGMSVIGDALYLSVIDYHQGSQLWKSSDGEKWEVIFREPDPNFFQEGGGPLNFKGHFLWFSNDLKNGFEVWRTDEVMVAEETTTTTASVTSITSSGETSTSIGETSASIGSTASSDGGSGSETGSSASEGGAVGLGDGDLSGGWIGLIAVLALLAAVGLGAAAFLLGKMQHKPGGSGVAGGGGAAARTRETDTVATGVASTTASAAAFCVECGEPLSQGAKFCAGCGSKV